MPILTIIAGPNGSGKSTLSVSGRFGPTATLIDPDAIARALNPENPARAALAAGRQAILLARHFITLRETFAVETTLAGSGQLALLAEAKRAGFVTNVLFIALDKAEMNIDRVALRVSEGGHDVPTKTFDGVSTEAWPTPRRLFNLLTKALSSTTPDPSPSRCCVSGMA